MPPRIPSAARPLATASAPPCPSSQTLPFARTFSTTAPRDKMSQRRRNMFRWLGGAQGRTLADSANAIGPKYVGGLPDQPFPLNPQFRSQPVLSEHSREMIFDKVTNNGETLKAVSAELGVDVRRVAAVVRLKAVERQWRADGKKLATPYAKAVMRMLPQTQIQEGEGQPAHEPVNDIHVHRYTMQQLFVPVSESRQFTREDAAAAFHRSMLSVDKRSPQLELIEMERRVLQGVNRNDSKGLFEEATRKEEEAVAERIMRKQVAEEKALTRIKTDRYEFRFRDMSVQAVGPKGKSRAGTGWRYGAPHEDRKKGKVKIPTSVP